MKTSAKWLVLLCAIGVGFTVAACDEEAPTGPQEVTAPTITEPAANPADDGAVVPLNAAFPPTAGCMGNDANLYPENVDGFSSTTDPTSFNCTAGDVVIANARTPSGEPIQCIEGSTFTVDIVADIVENAESERVDIGIWIENGDNGAGGAEDGTCDFFFFDGDDIAAPQAYPIDIDGDECGDMSNKGTVTDFNLEKLTLTCPSNPVVQDGKTFIEIESCISWTQPGGDRVCAESNPRAGTLPANKSKCECDAFLVPVEIRREAKIKVRKDLTANDPGLFDLRIWDADDTSSPNQIVESKTDATDGGETAYYTFKWVAGDPDWKHTAFVQEVAGTNTDLKFYKSSYVCKDKGGTGTTVASGTDAGPSSGIVLANMDDIVCTFKNDRIPVPTVAIEKTVKTSFTRTWDWTIKKQAFNNVPEEQPTGTSLNLMVGDDYFLKYFVTVDPTYKDSEIKASGEIKVTLTGDPVYKTTVFGVSDVMKGTGFDSGALSVKCPDVPSGGWTASAAGTEIKCTWSYDFKEAGFTDVTKIPMDLKNNAKVDLTWNSTDKATKSVAKDVKFGDPTKEIDEMVTVSDNKGGTTFVSLGTATKKQGVFEYVNSTGPCAPPGDSRLNTAKLVTNDTQTEKMAQHTIDWACKFVDGCTLTQGYWKTHSEFGPAPWNKDVWGQVMGTGALSCGSPVGPPSQRSDGDGAGYGASVVFNDGFGDYVGSVCYFDVYWSADNKKGNFWYHLAHQYIAAELNVLSGADPTAVSTALADAKALLEANAGTKTIDNKNPDRDKAVTLAGILADYNEGEIGPGHCDDDDDYE
jgi:hypothetical protein